MIFYEKWQQHLPKKNPGPKCPEEEEEEKNLFYFHLFSSLR
jgi:hypothetical protein